MAEFQEPLTLVSEDDVRLTMDKNSAMEQCALLKNMLETSDESEIVLDRIKGIAYLVTTYLFTYLLR